MTICQSPSKGFMRSFFHTVAAFAIVVSFFMLSLFTISVPAAAQTRVTAFKQAVAEAAARDRALAEFYRINDYAPVWTGNSGRDRARRQAFLAALARGNDHGLPMRRYDPQALKAALRAARSARDRGRLDVQFSQVFLQYARDIQTGILVPSKVDPGIVRKAPRRGRLSTMDAFVKSAPAAFLRALPPKSPEYVRLMKAKLQLEKKLSKGGWGPKVAAKFLKPGQSGAAVVSLRNRMIAMGYMRRSSSRTYDGALQKAVQQFQFDHGLPADGVAGKTTIRQLNVPVEKRLQQVIVAMERERWINMPLGKRHIIVNLADFRASIVDNGKVTFTTRAVVGKNTGDRRSPEFSDLMEFMIINPTWNVPRSIAIKEYLPRLQQNPNAAAQLRLLDARGQTVNRADVDFSQYDAHNFPFDLKQAPSNRNALGLVKFMFPNPYNIYLHDTPSKSLFGRNVRAFSHGCIRLQKPFGLAYALLARQVSDPKVYFQKILATHKETKVMLKTPVPVHLIYRTAFTTAKGRMNYRRDIYGRDTKIFNALAEAGVVLRAVRS